MIVTKTPDKKAGPSYIVAHSRTCCKKYLPVDSIVDATYFILLFSLIAAGKKEFGAQLTITWRLLFNHNARVSCLLCSELVYNYSVY